MSRRGAIAAAIALVLLRSLVYAIYPQAHFDSDQAIVGLMAKHLAEGRAFPLFFYGQPYMLAVEAWAAVPWFWLFGPTVFALRASLILTNAAVAAMLVTGLVRWGGVRPALALAASIFFVLAPPLTSARLVEAQGGNVEPFFWILVLWWLRDRPLWFGAVLGVAFLNREFSLFAVPVIVAGQLYRRVLFTRQTMQAWALTLVAFLFVWQGVEALKPYADLRGPGTHGRLLGGEAGSQVDNLAARISVNPADVPPRMVAAVMTSVPELMGGRRVESIATQGRDWMGRVLGLMTIAAVARVVMLMFGAGGSLRERLDRTAFAWYLLGVGSVAIAAFAVTRPVDAAALRYVLLGLLVPIGVTAMWLSLERRRAMSGLVLAFLLLWTTASAIDNVRQFARYASGREPDPIGDLAQALVARGVTVAEAPYWRAYKIDFLTKEQVIVASTDVARIDRYQEVADGAGAALRRIDEQPCTGGEPVAGAFLCPER